ncbi:MAG TPA: plastocyanin/azurin family copper-binding protein [Planctomycetota bacterium]|nr:plastocyanin/azurin family copper-binding protein [Planctomycetota bacterium]
MKILALTFWRLVPALALLAGTLSCEQVAGTTTPVDTTPVGPPPLDVPTRQPSTSAPAPAPAVKIEITRADRFFPDVLVIRPGDTVEWTNNSDHLHAITTDPASAILPQDVSSPPSVAPFDSGYLEPGQTYRHRFTVEGEYRYACFLHETQGMTGRIVVTSKSGP